MELKGYQQTNLNALDRFLTCIDRNKNIEKAYREFWQTNTPPITPFSGTIIEPYKNNVKGAPHVCLKVPTGGGKTFIASAALKVIMEHIEPLYKVVIWLVPSNAILTQTLTNLRNKQHPYRQRIDTDFANRVEIFDKGQVLTGQGFSLPTVRENLCILVMSFDSFRTQNKEGRKVYQENGYLQSFAPLVSENQGTNDEIQLMTVLQAVHPVVVVDESHNATSELSEQMLNDLQPSLVLDLTATPRQNSNIICFTDALELKRNNMVKLPVIVYNHKTKAQVIDSALYLQRKLEEDAKKETKGHFIRPIVLFQAESNITGEVARKTFDKIKQTLLELNIPEEQIKIKTAEIDELKNIDLMSPDCQVRYIITVNALKEGWDCPFAYILASLADKSSSVDVEQIVGRVLRLPFATRNDNDVLNLSYVLTASSKFQETLQNVIQGLNHAGFSDRDYRAFNPQEDDVKNADSMQEKPQTSLFPEGVNEENAEQNINYYEFVEREELTFNANRNTLNALIQIGNEQYDEQMPEAVTNILCNAKQQAEDMDNKLAQQNDSQIVPELENNVKSASIQSIFAESAKGVELPTFYIDNDIQPNCLFERPEKIKLEGQHLLSNFRLATQDSNINFELSENSMYKVDIDEHSDDHTPRYEKVKSYAYKQLLEYIQYSDNFEEQVQKCVDIVIRQLGKMPPLTHRDLVGYITRVIEGLSKEQFNNFTAHITECIDKIKQKILSLEEQHKLNEFRKLLDTDKLYLKSDYSIPNKIALKTPLQGLPKMLHTKEEQINDFETEVINEVANLENIEWWTRNVEKKGFFINGFINHYPDFIIKTKKGKIVILETKGDHLDAKNKILLGNWWASKAGNDYKYCLVYNTRQADGAYTKDEFINIIKAL